MAASDQAYKRAVDKFAKQLARADWEFDSITGGFVPGSSGETPIPLPMDQLAPYKEISVRDGIVSYDVTQLGVNTFSLDVDYVGNGQVRVNVSYPIPGLSAPYNSKTLLGTVNLTPGKNGSLKNPREISIAAQTIDDGDGTSGLWLMSGNPRTGSFHAVGHEYGVGGYIENINALVSVQSPLS